jgi:hypothetical protein
LGCLVDIGALLSHLPKRILLGAMLCQCYKPVPGKAGYPFDIGRMLLKARRQVAQNANAL